MTFRTWFNPVLRWSQLRSERHLTTFREVFNTVPRKSYGNILLKNKKLLGRKHWIGNEVETSEALEVAGICTNKGRLSFESAMLL